MKIALIQLPTSEGGYLGLPVGVLALASFIKKAGHTPVIIDLNLLVAKKLMEYDDRFFIASAKYILKSGARILGFSVMCTTMPAALLVAKQCKKMAPDSLIIFGGPDASFNEDQLLKTFKYLDIIVRGEGENTLLSLLDSLQYGKDIGKIKGITFRQNNRIVRNPDRELIQYLDELPELNLSLLPLRGEYKEGQIEGGRGCPHRCAFCTTCKMWGRRFRIKSPYKLAQEMLSMQRNFPNSKISILHDNPLANRKTARTFLSLLNGKKVSFSCYARYDSLDNEIIKLLKNAGCAAVYIGIETASERMQKYLNKKIVLKNLFDLINQLLKNHIRLTLSFMMGFPDETEADLDQTLLMTLKCALFEPKPRIQLHLLSWLKGSDLFERINPRLLKTHFLGNNISPAESKPLIEKKFIQRYPNIFPSFFNLPNDNFSMEELAFINLFFNFLIRYCPYTAMLSLKTPHLTPCELAKRFSFFLRSEGAQLQPLKTATLWNLFSNFLSSENAPELTRNVLKHERFQWQFSQKSNSKNRIPK